MSKIPRFVNDTFNNAENDASSAMDAGYYTFTGSYCEQNFNKALHYFILANKLGHIDAINYIYLCYIILNKENTNESLKRLEENAYKGNSVACDILFNLYYEGKYVQKDISKAILFKELYIENTQYNHQHLHPDDCKSDLLLLRTDPYTLSQNHQNHLHHKRYIHDDQSFHHDLDKSYLHPVQHDIVFFEMYFYNSHLKNNIA